MRTRRATALALILILVGVGGCTSPIGCGVAVPDVIGKTAAQAQQSLADAGFKTGWIMYDEHADGAPGSVAEQDPAAGTRVAEGSAVNLVVSGPEPTRVPDVVGLTPDAASSALTAYGLMLGDVEEQSSGTVPAGEIIRQDPKSGTEVGGDAVVDVVVSTGPQNARGSSDATPQQGTVPVPRVTGLELASAQSAIDAAGLRWQHELGPGDGMTDVGFVYQQVPAAGTQVDAGTVVRIITWKGP